MKQHFGLLNCVGCVAENCPSKLTRQASAARLLWLHRIENKLGLRFEHKRAVTHRDYVGTA